MYNNTLDPKWKEEQQERVRNSKEYKILGNLLRLIEVCGLNYNNTISDIAYEAAKDDYKECLYPDSIKWRVEELSEQVFEAFGFNYIINNEDDDDNYKDRWEE